MYHKSLKRNMGLSVLILVLVSLSIGYAIISSNLELNGNAKIANMAWQVYFDNVKVTDGSTGLSVPTLSADKTSVSFTTSFTKPTDYYDFTLDLINAGTIAAKVDSVVLSGLTAEQDVYANYRVTYVGGGEISAGDTLNPGETREIRVRLEMDPDVDGSLLPSTDATLALSARINFVQGEEVKYLMDVIKKEAVLDSIASTYVTSSSGIDFSAVSSDTNGKGVYTLTSSASDKYPIYYYRGAVGNNNVIFGGFCWKMVRTTETGGIKLIYNGTPTDGTCVATGADTTIGSGNLLNDASTNYFGNWYKIGYKYSNKNVLTVSVPFDGTISQPGSSIIMAKSFEYVNGVYNLVDTITVSSKNDTSWFTDGYRYTCYNTSATATSCDKIWYYFNSGSAFATAFSMSEGATLRELVEGYTYKSTNDANSTAKTLVDDWYSSNMRNNFNNLEDTTWCSDRDVYNFGVYGNDYTYGDKFIMSTKKRVDDGTPSVVCKNYSDRFSVYSENGNADLIYPIALLSVDELLMAGFSESSSTTSYLYVADRSMQTMSPRHIAPEQNGPSTAANSYISNSTGILKYGPYSYCNQTGCQATMTFDVRPVLSLKVGTVYTSGTGTSSDPYIIG